MSPSLRATWPTWLPFFSPACKRWPSSRRLATKVSTSVNFAHLFFRFQDFWSFLRLQRLTWDHRNGPTKKHLSENTFTSRSKATFTLLSGSFKDSPDIELRKCIPPSSKTKKGLKKPWPWPELQVCMLSKHIFFPKNGSFGGLSAVWVDKRFELCNLASTSPPWRPPIETIHVTKNLASNKGMILNGGNICFDILWGMTFVRWDISFDSKLLSCEKLPSSKGPQSAAASPCAAHSTQPRRGHPNLLVVVQVHGKGAALALNQGPPCPAEVHTHSADSKHQEGGDVTHSAKSWDHYLNSKVEQRDKTRRNETKRGDWNENWTHSWLSCATCSRSPDQRGRSRVKSSLVKYLQPKLPQLEKMQSCHSIC